MKHRQIPMPTILGLFVALLQAPPASGQFVAGDDAGESTHAGNVGIGTTNPDTLLHLRGQETSVLLLENPDDATGQTGFEILGAIDFVSRDDATIGRDPRRARIVGVAQNESAGGAIHWYTGNSLFYQADFRMRLQADGRLALGKGPTYYANGAQLDIQADNNTSSQGGRCAIRLDDGNQAMGKVLTSDDQGRGTWQDPPAGGGGGPCTPCADFQTAVFEGVCKIFEGEIGNVAQVTECVRVIGQLTLVGANICETDCLTIILDNVDELIAQQSQKP